MTSIKETISAHDEGEDLPRMGGEREAFEADAAPMGFDLKRFECLAPEPWSEYADESTGHRWGGWIARATSTRESGPLTIAQIHDCARDSQIDFCMNKEASFEVAFARRIEKVRAALSAAPQSDGWRPIESAPHDGTHVRLYAPELQFVGFHAVAGWCYVAPGCPLAPTQPTHWEPLSPAPTQGQSHDE